MSVVQPMLSARDGQDHAGQRDSTSASNGAAGQDFTPDRATLIANGIFGFDPIELRSRSFMLLRTQLMNRFHRQGGRILAVTSPQAGNGKTYVTANVAAALSRIHPTILIDLDLRRPTLADRLGIPIEAGIDDYLAGDADWNETGVAIDGVALTVHGVRQPRTNSATLLNSDRLTRALDAIRAHPGSPICIVDTPPVLILDDMMLIAPQVDGVLMIVEEASTRGKDVEEALRILSPTPIVGSVLNKSLTAEKIRRGYEYYDTPA